ncbi:MAG: DUF362 domain-containing protein [Ignavibacteria bacterium]|nr:DUF362 domain-containing protein [Ignavibacteria bacterium]
MKRRDFLSTSLKAGILIPTAATFGKISLANYLPEQNDLIALKGGMPDKMLDAGLEAFGGIRNFVKKNQTVVIKPNIGWDVTPERAANTNPLLIRRLVEHCYTAGAKEVLVFDNTCDVWKRCYKNSGIEQAVKDAKGKIVPGNAESYYHQINCTKGQILKNAKVHELILSADVFINVPILKNHSSTQLSIGMKNLMGVVWDREYWHKSDLHQCIADFSTYRKPDLTIVDAYAVMKNHGPRGVSASDVVIMKSMILSRDIVAADTAAAKMLNINPDSINYIQLADKMKVGTKDLSRLQIKRITM